MKTKILITMQNGNIIGVDTNYDAEIVIINYDKEFIFENGVNVSENVLKQSATIDKENKFSSLFNGKNLDRSEIVVKEALEKLNF